MAPARFATALAVVALCLATSANPVDTEVANFQRFFRSPGVSVAVVRDGKVIFSKGYGLANVEDQVKVRPDTVFRIGSVSKQFLAAGILLLEQDGKLSVDDRVSKFIDDTPPAWGGISLRHLMSHTSGLLRETPAYRPFESVPLIDQIKSAFAGGLAFPTGSRYEYSNTGYFILAHVIEQVARRPWGEFVADRIFRPLGMKQTGLCDERSIVPNRARGYDHSGQTLLNAPPLLALRPSGAFISTVLDMAKWDAALHGETILTNRSKAKMWATTPLTDGTTSPYGLGWTVATVKGHRLVGHGGAQPGFRASLSRYLDEKLTVIVHINEGGSSAEQLGANIARHYISDLKVEYKPLVKPEANKLDLVSRYLKSRTAPQPDVSLMTDEFMKRVDWPAGRARFASFGQLRSLTALEPADLDAPYTHRFLAKFEKITLMAMASFKEGKLDLVGVSLP